MQQQQSQKHERLSPDSDDILSAGQRQKMTDTTAAREFPLREAHSLVRDLMTPSPWIYWLDFLFHVTLGWTALRQPYIRRYFLSGSFCPV